MLQLVLKSILLTNSFVGCLSFSCNSKNKMCSYLTQVATAHNIHIICAVHRVVFLWFTTVGFVGPVNTFVFSVTPFTVP